MATPLPDRLKTISQTAPDAESVALAIRPWRQRLIAQQTLHWTARGLLGGLFLACLLFGLARLIPWGTATYWATGSALACTLLAFIVALRYRPSIIGTTRVVDRRLALHDRLATAWELREDTSALARLQRRDALEQLAKHAPKTGLPLRFSRALLLTFAFLAIALTDRKSTRLN